MYCSPRSSILLGDLPLKREESALVERDPILSCFRSLIRGFCRPLTLAQAGINGACKDMPLLAASSSSPLSTSLAGRWTYLTTLPLMNTFFTELKWGYFPSSKTSTSSSLIFRYWSTDLRVPRIDMSFLSSTVTVWLVRVLKKL